MYVDPSGHTEAQLRDLVAAAEGEVGWNNETRTATATVNGIKKNFNIEDFKVEDGRIIIDSEMFDSMFSNDYVSVSSRVESKKIIAVTVTNNSGSYYGVSELKIGSTPNNCNKSSNDIKSIANGMNQTDSLKLVLENFTKYGVVEFPLNALKYLHYNRNNFNTDLPESIEAANSQGWAEMPDSQAYFHQLGEANLYNRKFVSPDGQKEVVFDSDGNVVADSLNEGTYNVIRPDNFVGHGLVDVVPYIPWGNDNDDPSTTLDRLMWLVDAAKVQPKEDSLRTKTFVEWWNNLWK